MKTYNLILTAFFICAIPSGMYAQDTTSIALPRLSTNFCKNISNRSKALTDRIDSKSDKALRKYAKYEKTILRKLYKVDSVAARNFSIVSEQKYKDLQRKLSAPGTLSRYVPSLDTIASSLKFLQQSPWAGAQGGEVQHAITNVTALTTKLKNAEDIKHYLQENKAYIKDQLNRFGLSKELTKINKDLYYYSEELINIKETFRDQQKVERTVLSILGRMKPFQEFIQKHGMLAGLFGAGNQGNGLAATDLSGLQTRSGMNEMIQNQLAAGGPNAQSVMQGNLQAGQAQLQQLKNKLNESGNRGSDDIMPEGFTPNSQKTKSFLKRLEVTSNLQSHKSNGYFPASTELGLGVGYRLFDAGTIGLGTSYKLGLGESIRHIELTHQGVGFRSYIDLKFPVTLFGFKKGRGSWWITGGYERNYLSTIKKIADLKDQSAWQQSALLGISKTISFNAKPMKGTKLQLLWDFLSYKQVPRPSPLVFRMGYTLR
jgi:uncharacterized protein (DUF2132 family)